MGLTIPADAYGGFPTTMAFEPSLYAEPPSNYILTSGTSPAPYQEDGDLRMPSSSLSTASATSSAIGSPQSNHGQMGSGPEWASHGSIGAPSIVGNDYISAAEYAAFNGPPPMEELAYDYHPHHNKRFVDPSLIHPEMHQPRMPIAFDGSYHHQPNTYSPSVSTSSPQPNMLRTNSSSPFLHSGGPYHTAFSNSPYTTPMDPTQRRPSIGNFISSSSGEYHSGDEVKEKQRCTHPDCGKVFKDLKAHMLTHQSERPEKCPIMTCEYHLKGFARKYDKNRHTLTHYKGNMVCGFCSGAGTPAEKSFNRADVFKRHLTTVHGVEQTPPNSRKKTPATGANSGKKLVGYAPDATGKCSTCSQTFSNAQDFYEHLDDCVLRIVQQEDPAEAINAQRLGEIENDADVHMTLEKNNLPTTTPATTQSADEDDQDCDMADEDDNEKSSKASESPVSKKANPPNGVQKSRGLTHSRAGVPLNAKKGRKARRDYPTSWGFDKGQMTMKKRVLTTFDGPRRLAKDDMMLSMDHEVRFKLSDGKSYTTDLDRYTLSRAEAFLNATDEEKGAWISDDPTEEQRRMMEELRKQDKLDLQEVQEILKAA